MNSNKSAIVVGAGLGGMATALRLAKKGYAVTILEQFHQAGGRLNQLKKDGFTFDMGPSFFSMSYEFHNFAKDCDFELPFEFVRLDPLYSVRMLGKDKTWHIYRDLEKLAKEFEDAEPDFAAKAEKFLAQAGKFFHDVDTPVIKTNFKSIPHFILTLFTLPPSYMRKVMRTVWDELDDYFESDEVKIIFSLVAFFLGATPFDTPALYTLLNYVELKHDGYYNVKGGMYSIVQGLLPILQKAGVSLYYNTKITQVVQAKGSDSPTGKPVVTKLIDDKGVEWAADLFVINADAASFRGQFLDRKKYSPAKLDKMKWTLAPFCIYLGVKGKLPQLDHHNYFLGDDFKTFAQGVFQKAESLEKPYYYVNVLSRLNEESAPPDCESLFILWPVPDLRFCSDWSQAEQLANTLIQDLSERIGVDLSDRIISRTLATPKDWEQNFSLYKGSGLGLAHDLLQIGVFRPSNKDEKLTNLYYVGASTTPGTGLPMVLISSDLVTRRICNEHAIV
jgi:phytoene desaturase